MKATVLRENLKEGLGIVERIVAKSLTLPILNNTLISIQKNSVKLSATDLQLGIYYEFPGKTDGDKQAIFAPRLLSSLVSVIGENQINLEIKDANLIVRSGGYDASIKTLDAEDFPIIPILKGDEPFVEVEIGAFCRGMNQVVGMAGQSQARPEISGIFCVFEKEKMKIVATDSFRLAEKKLAFEKPNKNETSFILPQKTARELISIFGEKTGKMKIFFSSTQAFFDYTDEKTPSPVHIQVVSRLIEGEYPHYEDIMPTNHKTKAAVPRAALADHVKVAGIFSGKTNEIRVLADPTKKGLFFSSQSNEAGENKSFLEGEVTGDKVEAAFNWRFLSEGIAQMKGENLEFGLNGEDGPALLQSGDQEGYVYVIMPIKA